VLLPARAAQEEAAVRRASSWTRASSAWVRCCASAAARSARKREDKRSPRFRPLRAVCKLLGGKLIIQKLINRFCTHRNTIKHLTVTRGGGPGRPPFWRTLRLISPGVLKNKP